MKQHPLQPVLFPLQRMQLDEICITKEDIFMKTYINPQIDMISIVNEDILTASNGGANGTPIIAGYEDFFPTEVE